MVILPGVVTVCSSEASKARSREIMDANFILAASHGKPYGGCFAAGGWPEEQEHQRYEGGAPRAAVP
eukprot:scaffold98548_cov23-Tisochrysis_lutea.AAC.1